MAAYCVDLVHKNDAGRVALGLVKKITHPAGAHAHKHLDELGTRDGKEGDPSFARYRLGHEGLARAGRTHQDDALGDTCAQGDEFLWFLEKLDDLCEFLFGLFDAGHIIKGDGWLFSGKHPRAALAEGYGLVPAALCLAKDEEKESADEEQG